MSRTVGAKQLVDYLRKLGVEAEQLVKDEVEAAGREIELRAKQLAPVDLGTLRRSINFSLLDNGFTAFVTVNVDYGIYQEVGTGAYVDVKPEFREVAEYYKGKGIKKVNLRPQPFLYPAYVEGRKMFIENLTRGITRLVKK